MLITIFVIAIIFSIYLILIMLFIIGIYKVKSNSKYDTVQSDNTKFSIIIPFRNEENNLETLIQNIANQTYSKENFQLILVDDFSTDNSLNVAKSEANKNPSLSIKIFQNSSQGKKGALKIGINNADFDFIITSDADCIHNRLWLQEIANCQKSTSADMIIAPVSIIKSNGLLAKFQEIEFLSLQASTIGSVGINKPIMCNGANLAYSKKIFDNSDIKEEIASGDDIFLLQYLKNKPKYRIEYLMNKNAIVSTYPSKNLSDFLNQRTRWASKSKRYNDIVAGISALLIFCLNITLFTLLILSTNDIKFLIIFGIILIAKSIIDYIFMVSANKLFKIQNIAILIIPFEIIYLFYTVYVGIISLLPLSFTWKGRIYKY